MNKEELFNTLKGVIIDLFEIDAAAITPQASLYEDLDLDSIDAVDLAVKITEITGKRVNPDDFKKVVTVQDLVDTAEKML
jgi:acyl carrier protein